MFFSFRAIGSASGVARSLLAFLAICLVCGCSPKQVAGEQLVFADAQSILTSANNSVADYGIAKGIAQVAEIGLGVAGQNVAASAIASLVTEADARVAQLQSAIGASQLDLANIQSLVSQINAQIEAIRLKAAPAVTVTPNGQATAQPPGPIT